MGQYSDYICQIISSSRAMHIRIRSCKPSILHLTASKYHTPSQQLYRRQPFFTERHERIPVNISRRQKKHNQSISGKSACAGYLTTGCCTLRMIQLFQTSIPRRQRRGLPKQQSAGENHNFEGFVRDLPNRHTIAALLDYYTCLAFSFTTTKQRNLFSPRKTKSNTDQTPPPPPKRTLNHTVFVTFSQN
ncbi:uncharacterized protein BCR38DRAFT_5879 [Pseudomassariella vexata]|uniref:Uncharacterized protein n=1 Tax=Pseudomassariella vexata TaxID=1141098 RepID=A0A1Y2EJ11_9PEZI|nr:uncharacterized protein BCR38DRAFT_5879 [Pseudomassariella vexata]ORY71226.1 hypothetical protein BCR38DRAFT_5879 [Pseudomassariella vexata]